MLERFTNEARQAVDLAREEARRLRHEHVGTEHLLLGLLGRPETLSAQVLGDHGLDHDQASAAVTRVLGTSPVGDLDADALESIGIDLSTVREKIESVFGPGALDRDPHRDHKGVLVSGRRIMFTRRARKVLELAVRESIAMQSGDIRDGHVLLGLIREGEGLAARIMADAGVDFPSLTVEVRRRLT
ncbi:Clp protease N-terminal domain-containing protein [Microbispora sp. NPDC049125]|uniref:Clp protease N-terminal domain-containing protein n=1 Tax=Microbispora sp. NPDC049125 TaxID=3154929 RepID=UPI0034672280